MIRFRCGEIAGGRVTRCDGLKTRDGNLKPRCFRIGRSFRTLSYVLTFSQTPKTVSRVTTIVIFRLFMKKQVRLFEKHQNPVHHRLGRIPTGKSRLFLSLLHRTCERKNKSPCYSAETGGHQQEGRSAHPDRSDFDRWPLGRVVKRNVRGDLPCLT